MRDISPVVTQSRAPIILVFLFRVLKDAGKIDQNEINFNFEEEPTVDDDYDDDFWGDKSDPKKFKMFKGFGRVLKVGWRISIVMRLDRPWQGSPISAYPASPTRMCLYTKVFLILMSP